MPELIIGHTTSYSVRVWARGGPGHTKVRLSARPAALLGRRAEDQTHGPAVSRVDLTLDPARDYTGCATLYDLAPSTHYTIQADFPGGPRLPPALAPPPSRVTTFPVESTAVPFSFVHGGCNLSWARLTELAGYGSAVIGGLALRASMRRPDDRWHGILGGRPDRWPLTRHLRALGRDAARVLVPALHGAVLRIARHATRFEQERHLVPSPFAAMLRLLAGDDPPAFVIHAGDQIYTDIDLPPPDPELEVYRRTYRQTWFEDRELRQVLASCPNYMALDDHEIKNNFDNDEASDSARFRVPAEAAYNEYVHVRHPRLGKYRGLAYAFQHGATHFFVMSTRLEREPAHEAMISQEQLQLLREWLEAHPRELKFIVSTVPFVAQLRELESARSHPALRSDLRGDQWSSDAYKQQRESLIDMLGELQVQNLVFLVSDSHSTYHACMRIGSARDRVTIHELAGGPFSQLDFSPRGRFYEHYRGRTPTREFSSTLLAYHAASPSFLHVRVAGCRVDWEAVRTRVLPPGRGARLPDRQLRLRGQIRFASTASA